METKRLYLREQSEEDADELLRLYEQKETSVFQETKALSRREVLERIRAYRQYYQFFGYGIWVICLKENDRMIGLAGFSNLEVEGKFCLDLGYVLDSPYRHQGYALEACRGILDFAGRYFDDREEG